MISIEVVGGIKAEPVIIKTEFSKRIETNIVEISKEDIGTEFEEEVEQNIKLEDNANNTVEIGIEDIQGEGNTEDGVDVNMETDSKPEPNVENIEAVENNNNNMEINFQGTENVKRKETEESSRLKVLKIVLEKLPLNYENNLQNIRKNYKRQQEKIKNPTDTSNKNSPHHKTKKFRLLLSYNKIGENDYTAMENQQYRCNNCQFLTTNKRHMRVHIRNNHRHKDISSGMNEENLKNALKIRAESSTNIRFISWYEYKLDGENKYRCNHCQTVIENENKMFSHILDNHRKLKMNQCPHCPYQSQFDISTHITSIHTDEKDLQYFRCDKCECKFKLKNTLRRHMLNHMDPDFMKPCPQCPKMFKYTSRLKRHIREIHKQATRGKLKCFHCEFQCVRKESLMHHLQSRHMKNEDFEILQCKLCPYQTQFKMNMRHHINLHYKPKQVLQCHICSYQCTKSSVMDLHLIGHKKKKDEEDLRYRCNKCDYKTYRMYSLKVHKLNHLKPEEIEYFYCYHCDFKAKRKDNLKSHIFRHQKKEELPLQCFICDFTTKKRDQLIRHVDMHSKNAKKGKVPKTRVIPPS